MGQMFLEIVSQTCWGRMCLDCLLRRGQLAAIPAVPGGDCRITVISSTALSLQEQRLLPSVSGLHLKWYRYHWEREALATIFRLHRARTWVLDQ